MNLQRHCFRTDKKYKFIKKPTFVLTFFKQLDNKREIWFRIYFRKFNKDSFEYEYQFFFKYQNFYFKYDKKKQRDLQSELKSITNCWTSKTTFARVVKRKVEWEQSNFRSIKRKRQKRVFIWTETEYSECRLILISSIFEKLQFRKKKLLKRIHFQQLWS